jgi:hypothetical protein
MMPTEPIAGRLNSTPGALFPRFVLGDAGELRDLLASAGFQEVSAVWQSLPVPEPWDGAVVAQNLKEGAAHLLAQAAEREIGPALRRFIQGAELVYPMSAHIAIGWK